MLEILKASFLVLHFSYYIIDLPDDAGLDKSNFSWCMFMYSCLKLFVHLYTSILKYLYMFSQKNLTCLPHKHKPLQLDDYAINTVANLFVQERMKIQGLK